MLYAYETDICYYSPKDPNTLCSEMQSNVYFSVKAEKMSSDDIAGIRTVSHCIDTRDFYFLKKLCAKMRLV